MWEKRGIGNGGAVALKIALKNPQEVFDILGNRTCGNCKDPSFVEYL